MKERFLIITFLGDLIDISAVRADFKNKTVNVIFQEKIKFDSLSKLKKIFLTSFYPQTYKVILAFDSKNALTNHETISLKREDPKKAIDEADIENLVSQALWKVFDYGRIMSTKQLNLNDLEILLVDTKIHELKIDGRRVLNPIKQKGEKIDITVSQTFANRSLFDRVSKMLPKRAKIVLAIEGGVAASRLIGRLAGKKNFVFGKVLDDATSIHIAKKDSGGKISFFDYFSWGKNGFYASLEVELGVCRDTGKSILKKFFKKEMSDEFERRFGKIFSQEIIGLTRGLTHAASRTKHNLVFLDFPPLIPNKNLPKMILPVDSIQAMKFLGFKQGSGFFDFIPGINPLLLSRRKNISNGTYQQPDFVSLASLFEFYFLPQEDLVNRLAKRRIRWLMP
ncbi:hypothetical protein HY227_02210 [Candidatus Wolfebacteria bacterium]|nr:hypothetical protein [Candidatus Wolfebacteria bacterium]